MALKGNTTLYLLAGTCIDMDNTIWMSRFAFHDGAVEQIESGHDWSGQLFQWFKAHSISRGYWYMTTVSPGKGYFDIGRNKLVQDLSTLYSQEGLGSDYVNQFLDNPNTEYILGIPMVDYVVWTNDNGNPNFYGAFVDKLEAINMNTVRVYYTIDAIITYQLYFYFGTSWIEREHCYQDWAVPNGEQYMVPNWSAIGTEGEPFEPSDNEYIFETIPKKNGLTYELEDFGNYDQTFVMSDIDLTDVQYIKAREEYPAFAQFSPAERTEVRATHYTDSGRTELIQRLSIGVFRVDTWKNAVFEELGKYNAFEHILYTYTVPHKLVADHATQALPQQSVQVVTDVVPNTVFEGDGVYPLELPTVIRDGNSSIDDNTGTEDYSHYKPLNAKCYYAPYYYVSVTDCLGSSMEFQPQLTEGTIPKRNGSVRFEFSVELTTLPNVASALFCSNYKRVTGGRYSPMYTLWQMSAYSMTPNASGYGELLRDACMQRGLMYERVKTSIPWLMGGAAVDATTQLATGAIETLGSVAGSLATVKGPLAGVGMSPSQGASYGGQAAKMVSGPVQAFGSGISNILSSFGGGVLGGAVTAANGEASNKAGALYDRMFGLPKAVGGLGTGTTVTSLKQVGYKFFFVHVNTYTMRKIDSYFSLYGYTCNQWKFPNINIRRRWCYVKTRVCVLEPVNDAYDGKHAFFIPRWAQEQIKERMNNGLTFWNLRWALYGDVDESNRHDQWYLWNEMPQNIIRGRFVHNYGDRPDSQEMKDNQSTVGGYCDGFYNPRKVIT